MKVPKIKTMLEVKNEASEVAELYLYGNIRQAFRWDDEEDEIITAKRVRNELKKITAKKINIHINSGGGDVFESIAIHNLIKNHEAEKVVIIDGVAASGGSIIAMAGDKRIMPSNTMMMIHKAWTIVAGNADELRKVADDMEKIDTAVLESYSERFVGDKEELKKLLSTETWLTAEECKALGFCDEIADEIKKEPEEPQDNIKDALLNKYKKEIAASAEKPKAEDPKEESKEEPEEEPKEEPKKLNSKQVLKAFFESF